MAITLDGTTGITTPSDTISGNLTFTGTGNRITGDFSNATTANRVMFQTSTTNGATSVYILPNGTSTTSQFVAVNNSDPTNASVLQLQANATEHQIRGGITGTGTYLPMTFYTGGSERMRVDTSGNLGIGTASPRSAGGYTSLCLNNATTGTFIDFNTAGTRQATITATTALFDFQSALTAPMTFSTNGAVERMRIDSSGNVGIGTTTLTNKFNVAGAIASTSILTAIDANSIALSQESGYSRIAAFGPNSSTAGVLEIRTISTNGGIQYGTRFDATGNVIVGANVNTTAKGNVTIWGAANVQTNYYLQKNGQVEGYFGFTSGASTNLYVNTGATMGSTGVYMGNGGTSWTSNSDERLKENLVPITDAISKVSTLRSVIGNFIADENKTPRPFLIAQDVQQVLPEAIGTSEIDGVEYLGVSYTEVIPLLVAAIKEQQALITALTARIEALETK